MCFSVRYDALGMFFLHVQVTGYKGCLGCNYNSNQQLIRQIKRWSWIETPQDEVNTTGEMCYQIKVLKWKSEKQLKIKDCLQNLSKRFLNIAVLKPNVTVLKPSKSGDRAVSKFQCVRNPKSYLIESSVIDNSVPCALYLYISESRTYGGMLDLLLNI